MQTHTQNHVLVTSSGQPFRPSHVIACPRGKGDTALRIILDTGEVVRDHWETPEAARAFQTKVRYAMQGIVDVDIQAPAERPSWATPENAVIAAQAVLDCGGTRERAAQAYAHTLFGEGSPAAAIDAENMLQKFDDNWTFGLVYVLAGMPDPTHSSTKSPLTVHSPLARLAIAAVDQGKAPSLVRFAFPEDCRYTQADYDALSDSERAAYNEQQDELDAAAASVALTVGEAGSKAYAEMGMPRKSYTYCALNKRFLGDWVGFHGPLIRCEHTSFDGRFDKSNEAHAEVLRLLATHFDAQGYSAAAERLSSELR